MFEDNTGKYQIELISTDYNGGEGIAAEYKITDNDTGEVRYWTGYFDESDLITYSEQNIDFEEHFINDSYKGEDK